MHHGTRACATSAGLLALLAASCGGGSSSSSPAAVVGLAPPSQLSVVQPVGQTASTASVAPHAVEDLPAGSDYFRDPTHVYVWDPAVEPLQTINEILCYMASTGAVDLVNEGPYRAQIDVGACRQGANQSAASSQSGQSSGAGTAEIEIWTVRSARPDNDSPHAVHVWVAEEEEGMSGKIFVDVELMENAGDENPFGAFSMSFAGAEDVAGLADPFFAGSLGTVQTLELGEIGFTFHEAMGDVEQVPAPGEESRRVQVRVETTADESQGWAHVRSSFRYDDGGGDSGLLSEDFLVAFDETHFLRSRDGGPPVAYHRDEYEENVWRYGLYHADGPSAGERASLVGGFGFRTVDDEYGWIDYYGAWVPDGVTIEGGDMVFRDVYGDESGQGTAYTVVSAPGRLVRKVRRPLALSEIGSQVFEYWLWDEQTGESELFLVRYFSSTGTWERIARVDPETWVPEELDPPEVIDTASLGFLDLWSEGLGGRVAYVHGDDEITYYEEDFVHGDSGEFLGGVTELELYGFVDCLRSGITAQQAEAGDVFLSNAPDAATPHRFEFQRADLTLYHDTDGAGTLEEVGLAPGEEPSAGPFTWGMSTGPLVTPAVAGTISQVWDVWNADEFYVYETGHNPWNRFFGLRDASGGFVAFDPPLRFTYRHTTAADRNDDASHDGETFLLEYAGFGQLHGLPQEGEDLDGDGELDRFFPLVSLADGVELVDGSGTTYVVKAIEVEQTLSEDASYAGSLDVSEASSFTLPDGSGFQTPDIGAEPTVTGPPRVIDGEAVTSDP